MKKDFGKSCSLFIKLFYLAIFFFICGWFIWTQVNLPSEQNHRDYYVTEFNENWFQILSNGDRIPFSVPGTSDVPTGDTFVFEKNLPENITSNMWICFFTSGQDVSIYVDHTLRDSFSTIDTRPFGLSGAGVYLFIELDTNDSGNALTIEMANASGSKGIMHTVMYGDKMGILSEILQENAFVLICSVFMLFLAFVGLALCTYLRLKLKEQIPLAYLCWSVIALSIWILTQSNLRQLFFPNVSGTSLFAHFLLFLIPIPFSIYLNSIQKNRYRRFYLAYEIFLLLNYICNVALVIFSIKTPASLHPHLYFMIALLVILAIITFLMDARRSYLKQYRLVSFGFLGFVVSCITYVGFSLNPAHQTNGNTLCLGLIYMLLMATAQTASDFIRHESDKQKKIASSEVKSNFLASISHEIRTPINAVLGFNEIIASETSEPHIREYTRDIETAGRNLLAIINDILDFSKIESGKMQIVPLEYDLASVIHDSCSIVRIRAEKKGLLFQSICQENLPSRFYGDEVRIRQILINLLTNAIKYTHEGSVTLSVSGHPLDTGDYLLEFAVKDTGIGIKEDSIPLLFESFNRVDESHVHQIEGTGLGLNIVHTLVSLMNGNITVDSQYRKGSTFTVSLPQQVISNEPIGHLSVFGGHHKDLAQQMLTAPDAHILVVDDASVNLRVFCGLLKDTCAKIDTATSGRECITKLHNNIYDIIFLDHMMPEMDGIETLQQILTLEESSLHKTPVIMLTANAILGAKESYLQYGFHDYLSKPIQKQQLIRILKKYLPPELVTIPEAQVPVTPVPAISSIDFLDTDQGLKNHCDDEEFYLEIIEAYMESDATKELQEYFEHENWHDYQIRVHALGSSSKLIGANEHCTMFRALENAAKESDILYIKEHHQQIMAEYQILLNKIDTLLHPLLTQNFPLHQKRVFIFL